MQRGALLLAIFFIFIAANAAAWLNIPIQSPFLPTEKLGAADKAFSSPAMVAFPGSDEEAVSSLRGRASLDEREKADTVISVSEDKGAEAEGSSMEHTAGNDSKDASVEAGDAGATPNQIQPQEAAPRENTGVIAAHIEDPYPFAPVLFEDVNARAREALVNIFCTTSHASLDPISGSGVIISPNGIILTNAHVGQYVMLAGAARLGLSCVIRTGAPAQAHYEARMLFLPSIWVSEHAQDITVEQPQGTGENDWSLLVIVGTTDGTSLPTAFPFLQPDVREGLFSAGDPVLAASYPAGFLGGATALRSLYPASAVAAVQKLFTFHADTVDLVSLGGIILAQGGSSGGSVVNVWNRLVGIIVTASDGETTGERDTRAITLAHVDRSARENTGAGLDALLLGNPILRAEQFLQATAPALIEILLNEISS